MIETYASADRLAEAAAEAVRATLAEALTARARASLIVTGGRSPGAVYDRLAGASLDWTRVAITLSDERCVDPEAPESNARLVRDRLLTGAAAKADFLPLWPKLEPAALAAHFPADAVLLGMGEDGHVASLIPGDPGLRHAMTTGDLLVDVPAGLGKPPAARVSLSLKALLDARAIFLLIAGGAKRSAVERAAAGEDLPVRALLAQTRVPVRVLWSRDHER